MPVLAGRLVYLLCLAVFLHCRAIDDFLLVVREPPKFVVEFYTFVKLIQH